MKQNTRKDEILKTARELFYTKGYNNTSIQNITDNAKIAKATFYHYFKSKEDLLTQLTEKSSEIMLETLKKDIKDKKDNAINKLKYIFNYSLNWKIENKALIIQYTDNIFKDHNILLRKKINDKFFKSLLPIFSDILQQGKKESFFDIEDPVLTAEIMLVMMFGLSEIISPLLLKTINGEINQNTIINKLKYFQTSLERFLGVKKDSLNVYDFNKIELFLKED